MKKIIFILVFYVTNISAQSTYIVTSLNDSNPFTLVAGELRWALESANLNPDLSIITFNIPGSFNAPIKIMLNSMLPQIKYPVKIDGNTQNLPAYTGIEPKIIIDGNNLVVAPGQSTFGFILGNGYILNFHLSDGSTISNLQLNNFGNAFRLQWSSNNILENNVCMKNGAAFYNGDGSSNNIYRNNFINTDHSLNSNLTARYSVGIFIIGSSSQSSNKIGGLNSNETNYIFNCGHGVIIASQGSDYDVVRNNIFIGNANNIDLERYFAPDCGNNCRLYPTQSVALIGGITTVTGNSLSNDIIEIYKSNAGGIDAVELLSTVTADATGNFNATINGLTMGDKIITTGTDPQGNTSEFSPANTIYFCPIAIGANYQTNNCIPALSGGCNGKCKNIAGLLQINSNNSSNYSVSLNFGDGTAAQSYVGTTTGIAFSHNYADGTYTLTASITGPGYCSSTYTFVANIICSPPPCSDCIGSFAPIPDSTYIISAWVKEKVAALDINTTTYANAKINLSFRTGLTSSPGSVLIGTPVLVSPTGLIIDGWQKIEQKFKIPAGAAALKIDLQSTVEANFDDIRVFPFNGSMKSYVYDPLTMRLMAELDERNYATFYEYDEEGKLIRVKKETEKGIMTIKESRNSTPIK